MGGGRRGGFGVGVALGCLLAIALGVVAFETRTTPPGSGQRNPSAATTAPPVAAESAALREGCDAEHAQVFAALQGFVSQTGAVPEHTDALVANGWLAEHPDGWSSRWAIATRDGTYSVVAQPGSLCDA